MVESGDLERIDVFVSYSSTDLGTAQRLVRSLEQTSLRCWIAPRDVPPGAEYAEAIMDGIRASRVFVVLLSEASADSAHVRREVERASNLGKTVLPVRIEDIEPHGPIEYFVGSRQWIDAFPQLEPGVTEIAQAVGGVRSASPTGEAPARSHPGPRRSRPPWLIPVAAIGAALTVVVVVAVLLSSGSDTNGVASPSPTGPETETSPVTTAVPYPTTSTTSTTETTQTMAPNPPTVERLAGWSALLTERFDTNDNGWSLGDRTDDNGTQTYRLDGGTYSIQLSGNAFGGSYFSLVDVGSVTPVGLSTTFSLVESDDVGRCGIAVRLADGAYLLAGYTERAGRASVWLFDEGGPSQLLDVAAPVDPDAPARLTALIEPGRIEVSVDGVYAGEVTDTRIGAIEAVGVSAQLSENLACLFDDLEVVSP